MSPYQQDQEIKAEAERLAKVLFGDVRSVDCDIIASHMARIVDRLTPPDYRGYAHLGIGAYLLNHSAEGEPAELVISIATEEEMAGRVVGDERDNAPGAQIQHEDMAVRIRFENAHGLDALENQLRHLRAVHFADKFEYSIQNPAYFQDDEPAPTNKEAPQRGKRYGPYDVAWMGAGVWAGLPDELPPELVGKKVWLVEVGHNYGEKLQRNGTLK